METYGSYFIFQSCSQGLFNKNTVNVIFSLIFINRLGGLKYQMP